MTICSKILPLLLLSVLLSAFSNSNQSNQRDYPYRTFLGCTEMDMQMLSKKTFDSLIALPLCAKDTGNRYFKVQSFDILYAERGLYQDSAGLPIIFTDYTNIRCDSNVVPKAWVNIFNQRSYRGDTVYIENVKVLGSDNKSHEGKGLKIIIQ